MKDGGIAFGDDSAIKDEDNPPVVFASDEASYPLFHSQEGSWEGVGEEGVFAVCFEEFTLGSGDSIGGAVKGEFFDDHTPEIVTTDIDAFPET